MQAISHSIGAFAPINASSKQAVIQKPMPEITPTQTLNAEPVKTSGIWEGKSFSFWDVLDAINPLQHIPIISTIYRKITGDEMGYAARITGDALYSGLFGSLISGLVSGVANVFVDARTGKDIGEHVLASVAPTPSVTPYQVSPVLVATPDLAKRHQEKTVALPTINPSMLQAGIDQYKWQSMLDEVKNHSNRWV